MEISTSNAYRKAKAAAASRANCGSKTKAILRKHDDKVEGQKTYRESLQTIVLMMDMHMFLAPVQPVMRKTK